MGQIARILLVGCAAATLAACGVRDDGLPDPVVAEDYDAFFLWAGVEPPAAIAYAETAYILSGEVRRDDPARLHSLRAVPRLGDEVQVWLTVRTDRLDWDEAVYERVLSDLARWSRSNNVVGLQLDYDAPTGELAGYAEFLTQLRARLPERYQLSATGLLDWSSQGDPAALAAMGEAVDEVVVQTYRGTRTVPDFQEYTASLIDLPLTYRVGLVQNGDWRAPEGLESDPEFRGYVVFLVNE